MVDNEKVARAQKQLEELLSDKETMEEIRRRRMAVIDRNSIISIAEGRGEKAGKIKIAEKMLAKNKPIEEIIEFTELTEEEIKKLQKENKKQDMEK